MHQELNLHRPRHRTTGYPGYPSTASTTQQPTTSSTDDEYVRQHFALRRLANFRCRLFGLPTKTQKAVPLPCCGRYCSSALCGVILCTGVEFILKRIWTLICSFCGIIFDAVRNGFASACSAWQGFEIKLASSVRDTLTFKHIRPTWAEAPTTQTTEADPPSATHSASPMLQFLEQIWLCVVVFVSCFVCRSAQY